MYILNDWRKHKRVRTSGAQQPTHTYLTQDLMQVMRKCFVLWALPFYKL